MDECTHAIHPLKVYGDFDVDMCFHHLTHAFNAPAMLSFPQPHATYDHGPREMGSWVSNQMYQPKVLVM